MNTISRNEFFKKSLIGGLGLAMPSLALAQQA
jgi:hypothetical protein